MTEQETISNAPICATQTCKRPLTYLKESRCWRCLICNPLPKKVEAPPQSEHKYVDVKMTEDRVREIVRDELQNWHIQQPPVTRAEINQLPESQSFAEPIEENWRQKAKRLGIPIQKEPKGSGMRKKEDVLADIARLTEKSSDEDNNDSPVTAEKGGQ